MRRITSWLSLLLLALWMPVSSHAILDSLDLVDDHAHPATPEQDGEGGHDAADGLFRAPRHDETAPAGHGPVAGPFIAVAIADVLRNAGEDASFSPLPPWPSTAPPELACTWQFALRAAPPVRAPASVR